MAQVTILRHFDRDPNICIMALTLMRLQFTDSEPYDTSAIGGFGLDPGCQRVLRGDLYQYLQLNKMSYEINGESHYELTEG